MVDLLAKLINVADETRYEIYYEIVLGGRFAQQLDKLHERYGEPRAYQAPSETTE